MFAVPRIEDSNSKIFIGSASKNLRKLMDIPEDYHVLITSSANEAWERIIENCVEKESYHVSMGAFSQRFPKIATQLGRKVHELVVDRWYST